MASKKIGGTDRLKEYRDKLIDAAVLAVPLGVVAKLGGVVQDRALAAPWLILWVACPLALVTWLTWRFIQNNPTPQRHWRWAVLLAVYGSCFALLSVTDLLAWRTARESGQTPALREWILPVTAGDWRYRIAPRAEAQWEGLRVLLLDAPQGEHARADVRRAEAQILRWAEQGEGARGVAFDAFFEKSTEADSELCAAVAAAKFPVLSGYSQRRLASGLYVKRPEMPALPCLPASQQGHLIGYSDVDGRVRALQHWWRGQNLEPAFAVRVAGTVPMIGAAPAVDPSQRELRFLPPRDAIPVLRYADVAATPALLSGQFVLVGVDAAADRFETPFGTLPGTLIQAYSVHSILSGHLITRPSPLWSALIVFASCYVLMLLAAQGQSVRTLIWTSTAITGVIVVTAALCMALWLVWLDVIYGIVATWLWLAIMMVARRRMDGTSRTRRRK
jgi:CHASE2 domain-containing sensor protein